MHSLNSDASSWNEVFPNWKLNTVLNEISIRELEKRIEGQFNRFIAIMLSLDQIEPLNAWLLHSDLASLVIYEEELQLRGLVHMLECKPPMILSAYQVKIISAQT